MSDPATASGAAQPPPPGFAEVALAWAWKVVLPAGLATIALIRGLRKPVMTLLTIRVNREAARESRRAKDEAREDEREERRRREAADFFARPENDRRQGGIAAVVRDTTVRVEEVAEQIRAHKADDEDTWAKVRLAMSKSDENTQGKIDALRSELSTHMFGEERIQKQFWRLLLVIGKHADVPGLGIIEPPPGFASLDDV